MDDTQSPLDPAAPTAHPTSQAPQLPFSFIEPDQFEPPRRLGTYEIVRLLGQGGMGAVFEAIDRDRNLKVALKTIRPDAHASLSRFWNEFHALAELRHENLVHIYELVTEGPSTFYTMELVEGVDFRTWVTPAADVSASDFFDLPRMREAFRQLAEALSYIHASGHLHRDLKPTNVLVTRAGKVKVVDFGLAARIDQQGLYENSAPGQPVGTLAYMAPEQAAGSDLTSAADWYSFGVMMYECLTGQLPFTLTSIFELQEQKRRGVKVPAHWAHSDLGRLCESLLNPDPLRRPSSEYILYLMGSREPPAKVFTDKPALVGRDHHLQLLHDSYSTVEQDQRACAVFVRGPSGMGKSELIRCFLDELRDSRQAEIFRGRCYDSVFAPYKALEPIIGGIARRLQRMDPSVLRAVAPLDVGPLCEVFPVLAEAFSCGWGWGSGSGASSTPRKMTPQEKRFRAFAALRELLSRLGPRGPLPGSRPIIVFIDDLQWGDIDSAVLLCDLLRAPAPPLLLICAFRSEDEGSSPCLTSLLSNESLSSESTDAEIRFVAVEALTPNDAIAMVSQLLERPTEDPLCQQIAREANGNPLFVHELARSLSRAPETANRQLETGVRLDHVLWNRIGSIHGDQRQLLFVVAAAQRPIERHVAYKAAGFDHQDPSISNDLVNDRLLRTSGSTQRGHFDTYHDRVRETILSNLSQRDLVGLHRSIASTLQAMESGDDEFVGQQLFAAGDIEPACDRFRRAAEQAAHALAFDRAARLYRIVLDNARDAQRDVALRRKLATALANTGRCAEAAEQCLAAAPFASEDEALELHRDAALRYLTSGHVNSGIQTLKLVLNKVGMRLPLTAAGALTALGWWRFRLVLRPGRFRLRQKKEIPTKKLQQLDACWSAVAGLSLVDPLRAASFVVRHLYLAQEAGEPERLLRGLATYTGHVAIGGSRSRKAAGKVLQQLREVAGDVDGQYPKAMLALSTGIIAHLESRWDDAWHAADQAEQLFKNAEEQDVAWELDTSQTFAMWARMYAGRWRELSERQPDLRRGAIERDDLFGRLNFGARMATCVLLAADKPHEARKVIEDDESVAVAGAFHVQHHNLLLARVMIDLYEGQSQAAWNVISDGWRRYRNSLLTYVEQVRVDFLHMQGIAALAAARESKSEELLGVVEQVIRRLRRETVPWAGAIATLFDASLLLLRGQQENAIAQLRSCVDQFESAQMWLLAASARLRLAELTSDNAARDAALERMHDERIGDANRIAQMFVPVK